MKNIYVLGNWKANKTLQEAVDWEKKFKENLGDLPNYVTLIICPAYHHLSYFLYSKPPYMLGVQDISAYPSGAYTGELSGAMLEGMVTYAMIGHSERRKYFGETDEIVSQKVTQARSAHIKPIVCVSEETQVTSLNKFIPDFANDGLLLYEPLFAIGSGQADTPENANAVAKKLSAILPVPILYGGSVVPENVRGFIDQEFLAGVGVGGASLDPQKFINLITAART